MRFLTSSPASVNAAPVPLRENRDVALAPAEAVTMEETMSTFAALDVSQELTAVCVVNQEGSIIAEAKVATCLDAITA